MAEEYNSSHCCWLVHLQPLLLADEEYYSSCSQPQSASTGCNNTLAWSDHALCLLLPTSLNSAYLTMDSMLVVLATSPPLLSAAVASCKQNQAYNVCHIG
jgi:hypothetical protein